MIFFIRDRENKQGKINQFPLGLVMREARDFDSPPLVPIFFFHLRAAVTTVTVPLKERIWAD